MHTHTHTHTHTRTRTRTQRITLGVTDVGSLLTLVHVLVDHANNFLTHLLLTKTLLAYILTPRTLDDSTCMSMLLRVGFLPSHILRA